MKKSILATVATVGLVALLTAGCSKEPPQNLSQLNQIDENIGTTSPVDPILWPTLPMIESYQFAPNDPYVWAWTEYDLRDDLSWTEYNLCPSSPLTESYTLSNQDLYVLTGDKQNLQKPMIPKAVWSWEEVTFVVFSM
jgi:hypothetical protein